jgi:hypothetical protein
MTAEMERMNIPSGGLASFLTSNMDEIEDNVLAFGPGAGINSMGEIANRMAQMGRGGDNYIIHASEREMLVPREVVEKNPELRNQIMQSIAAEGADPEAYIVGSDANSINPMTGQREFFLKKLVSGVKKVVKGVVNVVKKVAPVVLPIALNAIFPGMGTIAAGALGSGIGTLIQGGSFKDALKGAAFGAAAGGLYSGISGVMSGQGFMGGIRATGLPTGGLQGMFRPSDAVRNFFGGSSAPTAQAPTSSLVPQARPDGLAAAAGEAGTTVAEPRNFFQRVGDTITGRGTPALGGEEYLAEYNRLATQYPNASQAAIERAIGGGAERTVLQRFGPTLAGGLAVGALTGAFNPIPAEPLDVPGYDTTSTELVAADPGSYRVGVPGAPTYIPRSNVATPTPTLSAQYSPGQQLPVQPQRMVIPPLVTAAQGGEMQSFPRRMGAISGPGTETSDDVPAMLSDGEFVMTARAVRGAGNGSREKGVRRMYDMMRMFEGGVAR